VVSAVRAVHNLMADYHVMIVAGEASGDLNGSAVANHLLQSSSNVRLTGVGSSGMREAGVELLCDSSDWGVIGLVDALRISPRLIGELRRLKKYLAEVRPALLLLIDYPFFNMRLAKTAHALGIPVVYYFPPSSWSRKSRYAADLAELAAWVATPFPWSADILAEAGCKAEFVGHPVLDWVKPLLSKEDLARIFKLDINAYTIDLMPGSRASEIKHILPVMLKAAEIVSSRVKGVSFVLIKAPNLSLSVLQPLLKHTSAEITITDRYPYDVMALCNQMLVTSGTATLEAAAAGVPMTVVYRSNFLTWIQARLFLKIPFISMPNIILDRPVITELLQYEAGPDRIAEEVCSLMADPQRAVVMKQQLAMAVGSLGETGANRKVAEKILEMLRKS
jgi:lipid-A-disaccharide synthase